MNKVTMPNPAESITEYQKGDIFYDCFLGNYYIFAALGREKYDLIGLNTGGHYFGLDSLEKILESIENQKLKNHLKFIGRDMEIVLSHSAKD